jgi:hypothetical protein
MYDRWREANMQEVQDEEYMQAQLTALSSAGVPAETIAMLKDVYEEHPTSFFKAVYLLKEGWTMTPTGSHVICITLRSADGECEVLGYGPTNLEAFEDLQLRTANFTNARKE